MANNPRMKYSVPTIAAILGVIGIVVTVAAFAFVFSPPTFTSTPTATQSTSSHSSDYQPEIIPPLTDKPDLTLTATALPTETPAPTFTPTVTPTYTIINGPLPDLTVTGLRDLFCIPDYEGTILEFTFFVRNIGRAATRTFGSFDVSVNLILGQRRYSLDEWDTQFDGVIGTSNLQVSNLNPNDDIKFTVVIDLKGNKNFGIEVIANSGVNPIGEADTTNNTLIKYFSGYCY
jgi:hypothetical protein